jgi:Ribosomal RNA adenine dimethylase
VGYGAQAVKAAGGVPPPPPVGYLWTDERVFVGTIDGLPTLSQVIRDHELVAKKALGQNFLLDLNLTAKIARAAGDLSAHDVLEVGPGPGGLTRGLLAEGARRVLAVERMRAACLRWRRSLMPIRGGCRCCKVMRWL